MKRKPTPLTNLRDVDEVRRLRAASTCTIAFDEAQAAGLPGGGYVAAHWCQACEAAENTHTFRRLRAENADLRAASCTCGPPPSYMMNDIGPPAHAAGCPAVERVRMREERDGFRDTYHAELARAERLGFDLAAAKQERDHAEDAAAEARARAGRLDAALARIEALGHHVEGCYAHVAAEPLDTNPRCPPECPTATAKKAREETK